MKEKNWSQIQIKEIENSMSSVNLYVKAQADLSNRNAFCKVQWKDFTVLSNGAIKDLKKLYVLKCYGKYSLKVREANKMPGSVREGTKSEAAKSYSIVTLHRSVVWEHPE